jgi:hypothetical protein
MKIIKATRKYEKWLRSELNIFEADFVLKAQKLAQDPFTFLRGTYYRWIQLWPDIGRKYVDVPIVLSVGDLHAANFGTWRDAKEELVWGINDFDEAAPLPYTQDLIRLAASVDLAAAIDELNIGLEEACEAILDGYSASLESNGQPIILDDEYAWLGKVYIQSEKSAEKYGTRLTHLPDIQLALPSAPRATLEASLPAQGLTYHVKHRQAGVGSLGRPRYTILTEYQGNPSRVRRSLCSPPRHCGQRNNRWVQKFIMQRFWHAQSAVLTRSPKCMRAGWCADSLLTAAALNSPSWDPNVMNGTCCIPWAGKQATSIWGHPLRKRIFWMISSAAKRTGSRRPLKK